MTDASTRERLDLDRVYEDPSSYIHPTLAEPGFTMPERRGLEVYDLDDPEQRQTVCERHQLSVEHAAGARQNQLAIHRDLSAPKLTLSCKGDGGLCVLGPKAAVNGRIELKHRTRVVIAGQPKGRLHMRLFFHSADQRFFWGSGSSCMGLHNSVREDGVAVVVGDDCMLSWGIGFRPSDMHLIIDLASRRVLNPAADIVIEPHVWIAQEVLVLKGARIGAGTIIGGKSLVSGGTFERMSIYAGNPARKVRDGVTWDRAYEFDAAVLERVCEVEAKYAPCQPPEGQPDRIEANARRVRRRAGRLRRKRIRW